MNRNLLFLSGAVLAAACSSEPPPMVDTTCDAMPAAVTMTQLQTEIFEPICKSCHFPPTGSGIAFGDYTTVAKTFEMVGKTSAYAGTMNPTLKIVDVTSATTALKLGNSSLWLKVSAPTPAAFKGPKQENCAARMPNDGAPLPAADLKKIKDWICRGAPM